MDSNKNMIMEPVLPSSFPATKKGYNSYLKALGINPKDQTTILFGAINYAQFVTIDRRSLDEKIAHAGAECERLHDEWLGAERDGRHTDAAFADAGWTRWSKEFIKLVHEKVGVEK